MITAYNVHTKQKDCPMQNAVITKTPRGKYLARGTDDQGRKMTALVKESVALKAIEDGTATKQFS